jgi:hypothetical protein
MPFHTNDQLQCQYVKQVVINSTVVVKMSMFTGLINTAASANFDADATNELTSSLIYELTAAASTPGGQLLVEVIHLLRLALVPSATAGGDDVTKRAISAVGWELSEHLIPLMAWRPTPLLPSPTPALTTTTTTSTKEVDSKGVKSVRDDAVAIMNAIAVNVSPRELLLTLLASFQQPSADNQHNADDDDDEEGFDEDNDDDDDDDRKRPLTSATSSQSIDEVEVRLQLMKVIGVVLNGVPIDRRLPYFRQCFPVLIRGTRDLTTAAIPTDNKTGEQPSSISSSALISTLVRAINEIIALVTPLTNSISSLAEAIKRQHQLSLFELVANALADCIILQPLLLPIAAKKLTPPSASSSATSNNNNVESESKELNGAQASLMSLINQYNVPLEFVLDYWPNRTALTQVDQQHFFVLRCCNINGITCPIAIE